MSQQIRQEDPPASEASSDANADPDDSRSANARVGVYHPKAGARNAGGVAVFVREMIRALAAERESVLFTEAGDSIPEFESETASVVPIESTADAYFERVLDSGPLSLNQISGQLSESVRTFVDARRQGTFADMERTVDVVFTHSLVDTVLLSNALSLPVVRIYHGCQHTSTAGKALGLLSRPSATVANSPQTEREVSSKLDRDVSWAVMPGVDLESFHPNRSPAFECDDVAILFVGRFVETKGVFDLLEAFAGLPEGTHLYLAGRGDTERVATIARGYGVEDDVTILGDVPYHRMPEYYVAADVACLPTHYESFGMVNVEAMACETPVVTTDLPGIEQYARDGENCLLVPPGKTGALRERLASLVKDPERRDDLAEAGRETATAFSWESTAEKLGQIADTVDA